MNCNSVESLQLLHLYVSSVYFRKLYHVFQQPICKQHTQLPHPHNVIYLFALLHPSISTCTSITPVLMLNCNYFATMAYLLPYLPNLTTFAHTVHRFFCCVIDYTFVYPMCKSVMFLSHCFALSWPGHNCKRELVFNWPTWLNKGEEKQHLEYTGLC